MSTSQTNQSNLPGVLYHYTNLESLALILENKTLRFTPLNKVDDLQENMSYDVKDIGRFFYASCWTDDPEESIPMWNMYASLTSGVRIALPKLPFARHHITAEEISKLTGLPVSHIHMEQGCLESFLPFDLLVEGLYSPAFFNDDNVLHKVEYTSDKDKLMPQIKEHSENGIALNFSSIGKYKNTKWEFQHEWRYLLNIVPLNVLGDVQNAERRLAQMANNIMAGSLPQPLEYYDLKLDDRAIRSIEVIPSPKMSLGNQTLLRQLMNAHGLSDRVITSELIGLI